jgi:hypothetical protein
MARIGGAPLPTITDDRALGSADIQRSLRFNRDDSGWLSRALGSPTSDDKASVSVWLKRTDISTDNTFFDNYQGTNDRLSISLLSSTDGDALSVYQRDSSGIVCLLTTTQVFRDPTSWYHLLIAFDTTQSTAADRVKIYVNGTQVTSFSSSTYFPQNHNLRAGSGYTTNVGRYGAGSNYFGGYMAEFNYIDGQQLSPTDVGFTDPVTDIWMPKRYEGTYGTNGFYLDFSDNSSTAALGIDKSPNGNDFTVNSPLATTDSMLDTPTTTFCTWNSMSTDNRPDIQEGNLKNMGTNNTACNGTIGVTSGKWYWEQYCLTDISSSSYITTAGVTKYAQENDGDVEPRLAYTTGRSFYRGGSTSGYLNYKNYNQTSSTEQNSGGTFWGGAVISFRLDMDAGTLKYYTNNTLVHTDSSIPTDGTTLFPMNSNTNSGTSRYNSIVSNFGQDSSFAGNKTAQGNTDENGMGDFYYPVPSGFRALCVRNLHKPTTSILNPDQHFKTVIYTGDNTEYRKISLKFKPDFLWFKRRNGTQGNVLSDTVRGMGKHLVSNSSDAETSPGYPYVSSVLDDGFLLRGGTNSGGNVSGRNMVAWCWKGGGASVSNTDGSVTTTISANPEAGFSIVSYTGGGNGSTMGHGLGAVPHWIIVKKRDSDSPGNARGWAVFHRSLPTDKALRLNSTTTQLSEANFFREDLMSTTVFGVNSDYDTGYSGDEYIAYVWTEIPGFSKFGSYTGNASTDGTYVHCGFRPAFVLTKMYDTMNENWTISDSTRSTYNPVDLFLRPDENTADTSGAAKMDFLSNGFKLRNTDDKTNRDGGNFIFAAFAEQPGTTPFDTYPNAR